MAIEIDSQSGAAVREGFAAETRLAPLEGGRALRSRVLRRRSPRDYAMRRLLLAADLAAVSVGLVVMTQLVASRPGELLWGLLLLPAWVVVFKLYGLYDRDRKLIGHTTIDELPWIFHAVLFGALLTVAYFKLTPPGGIGFADLLAFAVALALAMLAFRAAIRHAAASLLEPERALLVGGGAGLRRLARKFRTHPEYGIEPVGLISGSAPEPDGCDLPVLGAFDDVELAELIERHRVGRVLASREDYDEGRLFDLACRCRELGVKLSLLPELFDALGPSVAYDDVGGVTLLGIAPPDLPPSSRFLKRAMDLAGASALLVLTAPLTAVAALAVKLDSPGPAFFRQTRIGRGGRRFQLLKCRTMCADAEQRRAELLARSKDPGWLHLDEDPRVTRVGRFLRRTSIDELPQLWNVLRGEMSLVGPRPILEEEDRQLQGWRRARIDLTPGITGLWQVTGRADVPFEEMVKLDYLYVTNWSLWTDVSLILRTLPAVLLKRGVN